MIKSEMDQALFGIINRVLSFFEVKALSRIRSAPNFEENLLRFLQNQANPDGFPLDKPLLSHGDTPFFYREYKPIKDQICALGTLLGLETDRALTNADNLPELESFVPPLALGCTNWFAIPRISAVGLSRFGKMASYARVVKFVVDLLCSSSQGKFVNGLKSSSFKEEHFRPNTRMSQGLTHISKIQPLSEILIIAVQGGGYHLGCNTKSVFQRMRSTEFPLGSLGFLSMALTHLENYTNFENNNPFAVVCTGDNFAPFGWGGHSKGSTKVELRENYLVFDSQSNSSTSPDLWPVTFFIPPTS